MSAYVLDDGVKRQQQDGRPTNDNMLTISDNSSGQRLPDVMVVGAGRTSPPGQGRRPVDRYHLVFVILLIHGIGTLMPWNMFINAQDYFRNYKLANNTAINSPETELELTNLRQNFLPYLGLASQLPNVLFNGLNLLVNMGSGNLKLRVNLTLALEAIIFLLTIVLAFVDSSHWPSTFFYLTMASVVVLNMASGIYQNCVFGTGAKFPGIYTNAILIGSNLSGTFTSTVNLLSIWLAPQPQEAAIYYFITALFVILICLISYNLLPYNLFFRYFDSIGQKAENSKQPDELDGAQELVLKRTEHSDRDEMPESVMKALDAMVPKQPTEEDQEVTFSGELKKKWLVFLKCWPQCLNVFLTFYVTLAVFPTVLADVRQKQDLFSNKYFTPFACFFIFNAFAMIGNLISGWTTWPGKDRVWLIVVARFIFVPFFLFCNYNPDTRHWVVLIENDIVFIIGNVLFAATSGYLSSLCMMFASSDLRPDEAPKAGMLAAFFLVFGIFSGINSSFLLAKIVELGKN